MTGVGRHATRVGELVGAKYRIVRLLAEGGMGVVYEAQHTVVRRRFAIKFLRRDLALRRDILTRFHREAEAAGALESEHIAAAVDFGIAEDGTPYLVMEYLVGESLTALAGRVGPLPLVRAADLVCQAGSGMQVAHAAGIVHRDLKPQNLFVCRRQDGTDLLKVLDFGVAKLQALDEMSTATGTGAVVGTVAYMSPEQARGDKVINQRSDVYALGAILYELCSGRKPHPGDSQNAILHHIATQPAVPLASVAPELPGELVDLVMRTLAPDPGGRSPSAEALVEALAPFAKREVWPAPELDDSSATRLDSQRTPSAGSGGGADAVEPNSRARPRTPRSRRGPVVAAAAVAIAGALVVAVVGRQKPSAVSHEVEAPAAKPSLASGEQGPAPLRPALTPNAVPTPNDVPPARPLGGAGGSTSGPVRRHGPRPAATPAASSATATVPAAAPPVAPITFDRQNPYD